MGRIKTKLVKSYARELRKMREFSDNFDENKKAILEVATPHSKKIRNIVAGYITRLSKSQQ